MSNINTEIREMSHRESVQDYTNYIKRRKSQIAEQKKQEFENSLRESANREVQSNSALFGASKNIFETALTKDTVKTLTMMERKRKMQIDMASMINDLSDDDFSRFEETMKNFEIVKK